MVWHCGWSITFKEKLPKTTGEPAPGSVPTQGMESKNKFFLCMPKKRKKKTSPGKTTSDYSELLRPGAQAWRRKRESFLFPSSPNRRARCRWTAGQRLVLDCATGLTVCSGRLALIANCCHSQEEGGAQGIMTQVFLGWYSL